MKVSQNLSEHSQSNRGNKGRQSYGSGYGTYGSALLLDSGSGSALFFEAVPYPDPHYLDPDPSKFRKLRGSIYSCEEPWTLRIEA